MIVICARSNQVSQGATAVHKFGNLLPLFGFTVSYKP